MSGSYTSDISLLNDTFWVDLLSQRDVSAQVPINFVTQPSIALTAACFGDNKYDGDAASLCLSDLLTVGYFRFNIDVYWSSENQQWLLCPVSLPSNSATNATDDDTEYQLGNYTCAGSFTLKTVLDVFRSYISASSSDITATLIYLIFNMHAAADSKNPEQPAALVSTADLPAESLLLGPLVDKVLGSYIYTPPELTQERSDLKKYWFHDTKMWTTVLSDYFTTVTDNNNVQSTPDGWPCGSYLINKLSKRLLIGRGSIDPQLQYYNFTGDDPYVFPPDEMEDFVAVSNTPDGSGLQAGCFYNPQDTDLHNVNNSWAMSSVNTSSPNSLLLQNYTSCGISPMINETLEGQTANDDIDPYRSLSIYSLWSWASEQPQNITSLPGYDDLSDGSGLLRCAMIDPTLGAHWRAGNCSSQYRAACRIGSKPYSWELSENKQSFSESSNACPSNSSFDVPRTGLENTYFYNEVLSADSKSSDEPIWINFNSIDVEYCWVLGGANVTCIYTEGANDVEQRTILVPTIAAIIILTITASTIFVKCNSNRRISRRKRVSEGWEYEGVPS